MDRQQQDKAQRLRAVLRKMERSIDDARTRREGNGHDMRNSALPEANGFAESRHTDLDTPITGKSENSMHNGNLPSRTEGNMFDFNKPHMKARPKRRPAV